jgi:lysozyme
VTPKDQKALATSAIAVGAGLLVVGLIEKFSKPATASDGAGKLAEGIDVSHAQGVIDWPTVAKTKAFAFIKATEGTSFVDPQFLTNWNGASAAGVLRGAYHYFHPNIDPIAQAKFFLSKLPSRGELPLMLDVEESNGVSAAALVSAVQTWVDYVIANVGGRVLIYTSAGFWPASVSSNIASKADLFVANWRVSAPSKVSAWPSWTFWQYCGCASMQGCNCAVQGINVPTDLDRFNGTVDDLRAYSSRQVGLSGLPSQTRLYVPDADLAIDVDVAATPEDRTRGLSRRAMLPMNHGMLFVFDESANHAFWMKDTFFPLDIIFLDDNFRVVDVVRNTKPMDTTFRYIDKLSRYAIEVNAGVANRVRPGQQVFQ